jgi:uncharacterized protein DUF4367
MSSRAFELPIEDLESQLAALGEQLSWTPTPDLTAGVLEGLASPTPLPMRIRRRWWLAAAALAILLAGALLLGSASVRSTVADFLGIDGIHIEFRESEPETAPVSPALGTPTSMQELDRWLPFTPAIPETLGEPDAVYLRFLDNGTTLGMLAWAPSDELPETLETGLGALLLEFAAPHDVELLLKSVDPSNGTVTQVSVDGERGYWVEGASNLTIFEGEGQSETRPSGNVLIWADDGLAYRLESDLSMDEALQIAESMQPVSG